MFRFFLWGSLALVIQTNGIDNFGRPCKSGKNVILQGYSTRMNCYNFVFFPELGIFHTNGKRSGLCTLQTREVNMRS